MASRAGGWALALSAAVALAVPATARADGACGWPVLRAVCQAERPRPRIDASPRTPHDGAPVVLRGRTTGGGSRLAWDLDGDGAVDDATGAVVTTTFTGGPVAVRETDQFGRTGVDAL